MSHEMKEISVADLSTAIKQCVEGAFPLQKVRGEMSGFKCHSSGHAYFALKDAFHVIDGVCWRGNVSRLTHRPVDGEEVYCIGKVSTYGGRSKYQLIVQDILPLGEGRLLKILEERKKRLESEGLFKECHKKNLPYLPSHVGIITSPTGAVIQDMLHRLQERCPVPVTLWPVRVQGETAAMEVIEALHGFENWSFSTPKPDVIIIARGGGSLEDLWPFNDENLARAVFKASIPIVSAIGHEPDVTLIDYVADYRAPTPTAAAEKVVPVRRDLLTVTQGCRLRAQQAIQRHLQESTQRYDDLYERFRVSMPRLWQRTQERAEALSKRLRHPEDLLLHAQERFQTLARRFQKSLTPMLMLKAQKIRHYAQVLKNLSHEQTLKRGFTYISTPENTVVMSSRDTLHHQHVDIHFFDGTLTAILNPKDSKESSSPGLLDLDFHGLK